MYQLYNTKVQKLITDIINNFDFEQVKLIMEYLNWEWINDSGELKIPSIANMVVNCVNLLNRCAIDSFEQYQKQNYIQVFCCSGGFKATGIITSDGYQQLDLQFIPVEYSGEVTLR